MPLLGLLGRYWQLIAAAVLIIGFYLYASHQGYLRCDDKEKKAQLEELQRQNADLQQQVADFNKKNTELQQVAAQAIHDREKLVQDNNNLRHEGETLVKEDKDYSACAVPASGVRYIQQHY